MDEIESSRLTPDLIPNPDAGWEEIFDFAQTFDGYKRYGSVETLGRLAREVKTKKTLDELRATLFLYSGLGTGKMKSLRGSTLKSLKYSLKQSVKK